MSNTICLVMIHFNVSSFCLAVAKVDKLLPSHTDKKNKESKYTGPPCIEEKDCPTVTRAHEYIIYIYQYIYNLGLCGKHIFLITSDKSMLVFLVLRYSSKSLFYKYNFNSMSPINIKYQRSSIEISIYIYLYICIERIPSFIISFAST